MLSQIFSNIVHPDITVMVNWKIWLLWPVNRERYIRVKCQDDMFVIVQELCESQGGHPELSVLTSLLVSVDVKIY